ncbi:MAG TPA: helix-turn-helix domain-containing protein, partial [Verrucomicrobiae bacterium]|nr:helix-turn-helix domain-containing protein [Verrucomicrobiae bacterium]
MNANKVMVEQLAGSELFKEYEKAYNSTTGMPLAIQPAESFELSFKGKKRENPFCAMMARNNGSCAACLQMQEKIRHDASEKAAVTTCAYGISEAAVPVRLGEKAIGFLQTGQVFMEKPSTAKVEKAVAQARALGIKASGDAIRSMYLKTPVMLREKFRSSIQLLTVFAELLSIKSNQIVVAQSNSEPPVITRAKNFIKEKHTEEISLHQVAKEVHVSSFYLCKLFRKATSMTFTEFVCRTRLEAAKNLLLNPNLRVSEIVYEVGFQSLTHFNRVFKKTMGESPTSYRSRIPG